MRSQRALAPSVPTSAPGESLPTLAAELSGCTRCKLSDKRTHLVFGEGNPQARLIFVGHGPSDPEDQAGRPFVGPAGQLLEKMIEAIGLSRSEVYLCDIVKCRLPDDREPAADEIASCSPYLMRQLDSIRLAGPPGPKVIVALGSAAQTLLQSAEPISQLRGQLHDWREGIKLMPTFHPSYLLHHPESKRDAWNDLQRVAHELGLSIPTKKR